MNYISKVLQQLRHKPKVNGAPVVKIPSLSAFAETWDEGGESCEVQLYKMTFGQPFGPIKAGTTLDVVKINFMDGILQSFNSEGEVIQEIKFQCVPLQWQLSLKEK